MLTSEIPDEFRTIVTQFLCAYPLSEISWNNIFEDLIYNKQEVLLKYTVRFMPVLEHPIKVAYQREFLKYCIGQLETQGLEVHHQFYEELGRLVALPDKDYGYKHYALPGGEIITLKESVNIVSQGTTGLCTWQAALVLAEWCINNRNIFKYRAVLELGSGIGLIGITAALECLPGKFFLSDCHPEVISTICTNIKLSARANQVVLRDLNQTDSYEPSVFQTRFLFTDLHVLDLPWETIDKEVVDDIAADVILAVDVVYDKDLFDVLINAVRFLLGRRGAKAIFAITERNPETLQSFLSSLEKESLTYETLEVPEQVNYIWPKEPPVRIISISKQ